MLQKLVWYFFCKMVVDQQGNFEIPQNYIMHFLHTWLIYNLPKYGKIKYRDSRDQSKFKF